MKLIIFIAFSVSVICLYSCKKNVITEENEKIASLDASSSSLTDRRSRLSYGDSIFYLKNEPGNYIIRPVRRPRIEGYFKAIPLGLIYDSLSGRINVTQSETGLRYKMYYLTTDGQRADSTQIVISGIDYADGIYDLGAGQNTASPIYAANPLLPLPCDDDDDDDDDGCEFDERDLDDNGTNDIPGANSLGFRVNRTNAVINLYNTISSGALGLNPQNGATGDFLFYYRLSDLSNRALQAITVRLYYYNTVADIPASLINELNARNAQNQQVNSFGGTSLQSSPNQVTATQTVYSRPRRPPLIIIVGYE